jgi:hypothetical protein
MSSNIGKDIKTTSKVGRSKFRELKNPEPIEKEKRGIIVWGADNLYPHELIAIRQDNPIHGGILNQKITFISSAGADVTGPVDQEEVNSLLPPVTEDLETFNGFSVIFKKVMEGWRPEHIDFESVRFTNRDGIFAISDDWSAGNQSAEKTGYREIKDIHSVILSGEEPDTEVLLYYRIKPKQRKLKNGKLSMCYYPIPEYIGAMTSILAGIEQDYFTYSESVNGYKGGTLISMNNGVPATDTEADKIADEIKSNATDRDTQGGIVVVFADSSENATTVTSLNGNDLDKRYIESNKEIRSKILVGHSAGSPTLFAVNGESMFGSKEEMETAYTLFTNNYVSKRHKIMSSVLEWAYSRLGIKGVQIAFRKYDIGLNTTVAEPVNTPTKMSEQKDKDILGRLSSLGVKREGLEIVKSRSFDLQSTDEQFLNEMESFASLTQTQQLILKLIQDGKSFSEISRELGKGALALSTEIVKLNLMGLLSGWKVSDSAKINLEVRYSYEVKSGMGSAIIPGSREFCRELIALDRLYTRAEIDTLSSETGTDVWRYRGGWYHNPETGRNTPSCRHEWRQNIVRS